ASGGIAPAILPRMVALRVLARARAPMSALAVAALAAACAAIPPGTPAPAWTPARTPAGTPAATPTTFVEPTPTASPLPADPLAVVAALVGDDTAAVLFSDWSRIRGGAGPAATDPAERLALMQSLEPRAPAAGYAVARFRGHRAAWGWDTLDLAWEARLAGADAPVFALGLAPGLDLSPVLAHFRDRGFTETRRGSALVLAHSLDLAVDWLNTTELAIRTTAIFEAEGLMVLSSSPEELDGALDRLAAGGTPAGSRGAAFAAAVGGLGLVDSAVVELRGDLCAAFVPRDDPALAAVATTLHPWTALAAGWRTDDAGATARFAIAYDDPATASADLAGRARLAREGSTGDGRPLVEVAFRLVDARVDGGLILLDVEPAGGLPAPILHAVLGRDLVFAACGST
ncbi:MAG: hypothetical protein V2B17_06355, partial [Chloroflexota bacterium]